jgi:hypothetical protein
MADDQLRRQNHYVSRGYLRRWATDGHVWVYRLLVPGSTSPLWKRRSVRSVAHHAHLYTRTVGGIESDEIERWLAEEIEDPAREPLDKATSDQRLSPNDWNCILRFLAAQYVRTPMTRFLGSGIVSRVLSIGILTNSGGWTGLFNSHRPKRRCFGLLVEFTKFSRVYGLMLNWRSAESLRSLAWFSTNR